MTRFNTRAGNRSSDVIQADISALARDLEECTGRKPNVAVIILRVHSHVCELLQESGNAIQVNSEPLIAAIFPELIRLAADALEPSLLEEVRSFIADLRAAAFGAIGSVGLQRPIPLRGDLEFRGQMRPRHISQEEIAEWEAED